MEAVMSNPGERGAVSNSANDNSPDGVRRRWCDECNKRKPQKGFHNGMCESCVDEILAKQSDEVKNQAIKFGLLRLGGADAREMRSILNFDSDQGLAQRDSLDGS